MNTQATQTDPIDLCDSANVIDKLNGEYADLQGEFDRIKRENEKFQQQVDESSRRATIYEYMSEFMDKADLYGAYWEYIKEYCPDEWEEAGGFGDEFHLY
jgi:hypothetical protein|eukprot:COSAG06_NODE_495_length_15047_cov_11.349478_14_plen_100_part_00